MHWKDNCHLSLDNYGLFISSETGHPKSPSVVQELSDFPVSPSGKSQQEESCITPLCNWLSGICIILTRIYGKYVTGSANFPLRCPFLSGRCFPFLNIHAQMIYAGYIILAPGKPHIGRVNSKIHQVAGKLNFHRMKGKNPLNRVSLALLQRGVLSTLETRSSFTFSLSLFGKHQEIHTLLL